MQHIWQRTGRKREFWWENLKETALLEKLCIKRSKYYIGTAELKGDIYDELRFNNEYIVNHLNIQVGSEQT